MADDGARAAERRPNEAPHVPADAAPAAPTEVSDEAVTGSAGMPAEDVKAEGNEAAPSRVTDEARELLASGFLAQVTPTLDRLATQLSELSYARPFSFVPCDRDETHFSLDRAGQMELIASMKALNAVGDSPELQRVFETVRPLSLSLSLSPPKRPFTHFIVFFPFFLSVGARADLPSKAAGNEGRNDFVVGAVVTACQARHQDAEKAARGRVPRRPREA